jgi:trigger factor
MKVVKKKADEGFIVLDVTCSTSEVSEVLNLASMQFCNKMQLMPAKDRTPAEVAAEQMGIKDLDAVVATQAIEELIPRAINKAGVLPAYTPEPELKSQFRRGKTCRFELRFLPKPSYELSSYEPVSVTVQPFVEDDEEVDRQIAEYAKMTTDYETVDPRPLKEKDHCLISMKTTKGGEEVKNLTIDSRTYSTGLGLMPDGFDEAIVGMDVGETRTFTYQGPDIDEDGNEFYEEYTSTVTLLAIQREVAPVLNDDWVARNMPMYPSYAAFRASVAERVNGTMRRQYDDYVRNQAVNELVGRFEGSIRDEIYENTSRELRNTVQQQVASTGQTWDDYVEANGGEQQFGMMFMLQVRQTLIQGYVLDAVYRHEKLQFSDEDVNYVCGQINPQVPADRVRSYMESTGRSYMLRESAERLCAANWVVEHAEVKEAKSGNAADE